ncbi:MAG: hypothetical protein PWQ55_680 [Chloroflexota bacterium]|nr:hypothetical protein [Chloroflexota bacterium]
MSFTIEFQPTGQRLVVEEALTVLAAARQAGIRLRSDCGGQGTCGKCMVRFVQAPPDLPIRLADQRHLNEKQLAQGYRMACATVVDHSAQIFIPPQSMPAGQVLQTASDERALSPDPLVRQQSLQVPPAKLDDLRADFERLQSAVGTPLQAELPVLRDLSRVLRSNDWQVNLVLRGDRLQQVSAGEISPLAGLAVDVGSTKLACYLLDLHSGQRLAVKGLPNPQIMHGEDIMARLAYAQQGEAQERELHQLLMQSIESALVDLCRESAIDPAHVIDICLVGNTAMHHFSLGLPSAGLSVSPFVPAVSGAMDLPAAQLGLQQTMPGARVYAPPVIAGFVGSDHLAFLLASGFAQDQRIRLGIDIGTNTEIALQKDGRILSVSTASGPAFEGAHIRYGMRAAPGAIEHVYLEDSHFRCKVIGNGMPSGICGSGILDALGELRAGGLLNRRGRLDKAHALVQRDAEGKPFVTLAEDASAERSVTLSQQDIDQVLLAKGAIRAGIDVLMDALEVAPQEIDEVVIAGAFGSFMLPEQAIRIGMLPPVALERIRAVGNAAGLGAQMMLVSHSTRREAEALAARIEYLELTLYPDFDVFYANGIRA